MSRGSVGVSTLVFVVACGGSGPHFDVEVALTAQNKPVVGTLVYFQNTDSSLVDAIETDSHGHAAINMEPGGSVTIAGDAPLTYLAVQHGDRLSVDFDPEPTHPPITVNVTIPTDEGATSYTLESTCNSLGTTVTDEQSSPVSLFDCPGTADMLVISHPADGATPRRQIYKAGVSVANLTNITFDGPYTPTRQSTVAFAPHTLDLDSITIDRQIATSRGVLDHRTVFASQDTVSEMVSEPIVAGSVIINATTLQGSFDQVDDDQIVEWGPAADAYTLDLDNSIVRSASGIGLDVAAHVVSWSEAGPGSTPDAAIVRVDSERDQHTRRWQIVAPRGDASSIQLPLLPDELDLRPTDCIKTVSITTIAISTGYDRLRLIASPFDSTGLAQRLVSGTSGRVATGSSLAVVNAPNCTPPPPP